MDSYEKEMLENIDNGVELSRSDLRELVFEFGKETKKGENRRWSRSNETIIKLGDRFFSIDWEEGLTEMQPNEFYNQPIEVIKKTYKKTITVTEWTPKN